MAEGIISRSLTRAKLNLGIKSNKESQIPGLYKKTNKYRSEKLEELNKYYLNKQYDGLVAWETKGQDGQYVPVRQRKPRLIFPFAKVLSSRITSKIVGKSNFPEFKTPDDPETEQFFKAVLKASMLRSKLYDPLRSMCVTGSAFIRFYMVGGTIRTEWYNGNNCYPVFNAAGELDSIRIRYIYETPELDNTGKRIMRWFQLDLSSQVDVAYDNPEYNQNEEPKFEVVGRVAHGLGFVQGEWFRTSEDKHSPDGDSLVDGVLDFIDELNYNVSQSSSAVSYNQDPQLTLKGMDEEETENLIRSSTKSWNLGREGEAGFVESSMNGVTIAGDLRDKVKVHIQDIARVVLLDPEKIVGNAQSAKAMEVMHGPMVELIDEIRPFVEKSILKLIQKISLVVLIQNKRGEQLPFNIPPGWQPSTLMPEVTWPPIFAMTMEDLQKKVGVASAVAGASIMSRETMTRWLAADFGVENIEEEVAKVASQPVINPFGAF